MLNNLKHFLEYRKQNKIFSKELKIRRDIKIEIFLLFGLWKTEKFINILKRNCCCYLEYYEERGLELTFKDLNYIVARIATIYSIINNDEILETEFSIFDNYFYQTYIKNKTKELLIKTSDTKRKNLIEEAVI